MSAVTTNANDRRLPVFSGWEGRALLSSFVGVTHRLFQIAANLMIVPALMSGLGKTSFGVWSAAATLTWMATIFDLGIGRAVVLEFLHAPSFNRRESARRILSGALWLGAIIAVLELAATVWMTPWLGESGVSDAYLIAAACMAINVPVSIATALWTAEQKLYVVWIWESAQTIVTTVSLWTLLFWTKDVRWYVFASAGGVLLISSLSLAHFLIHHPDLRPSPSLPVIADIWRLFCRGVPYLILVAGTFLASQSDAILAFSLLGDDASAMIAICQKVGMISLALLQALMIPLWPAFANAAAAGDSTWLERRIWPSTFVVISAAIFGSAFILTFGRQAIGFWLNGNILLGHGVLFAIVISVILPAVGIIPELLLNAFGVIGFQVRVAILFGLMALALKIAFAHIWGVAGIIAATGIAYGLTHLPAYLWWTAKWFRRSREFSSPRIDC